MAPEQHLSSEIIESPVSWNPLYRTASLAAIAVVLLIPVQLFIFIAWPPPETAEGFFDLFGKNAFLGLLSLDLIYLLNNAILILFYLGLYLSLRKTNPSAMLIALILGLVGIAVYYSSSIAFEMLSLGNQYQVADNGEIKQQLLASARTLLAVYKGTAFDVYYVLNGATLLILSLVMRKSKVFSKSTALWGLASGILMVVPSTAGTPGLILSIASLVPWIVFSILASRKLWILSRN
jgi:hypothetical protein